MLTTLAFPERTPIPDGWSRAEDGSLRMLSIQAFQAFGALRHDPDHAPAFAVNLVCEPGMHFPEFLAKNGIELLDPL